MSETDGTPKLNSMDLAKNSISSHESDFMAPEKANFRACITALALKEYAISLPQQDMKAAVLAAAADVQGSVLASMDTESYHKAKDVIFSMRQSAQVQGLPLYQVFSQFDGGYFFTRFKVEQ